MKTKIKKLPTKEKIAKGVELKQLQDKARTLCDQENMCNKESTEKQAEAERVTGLIQPVQQQINEFTQALANTLLEHPSTDIVQELEQQVDEACQEIKQLTPILAQFQQKVGGVEQYTPKDAPENVDKEGRKEDKWGEEEKEYKSG